MILLAASSDGRFLSLHPINKRKQRRVIAAMKIVLLVPMQKV
jgi:hypothetical protein